MPFINRQYRTNNEKAIYGYSLGGMFTTHILFNRPELFNMVFIGAPGNNGRQLMPAARQYFKQHNNLQGKVFIGVGAYENETARNIDSFTNYLSAKKLPGLALRKDITPGANHGAALAQVMQNAVAFGYCERRQVVKINPAVFQQYKGSYISKDTSVPNVAIIADKNKLYWKFQTPGSPSTELVPMNKTDYFMVENERILFKFKNENGKRVMVVVPQGDKEYYFTRKE